MRRAFGSAAGAQAPQLPPKGIMVIIGVLLALGSAIAFLVVGALTVFGGVNSTQDQVVPGFRPDRPGPLERALTLLGVWGPVLFIAALCLLAGIQIFRVAVGAF